MRLLNFLCYYLLPVLNVIYGLIILSNPPKTISKYYGYRTRSSIRNVDTWMLAQKCSGIVCLIVGVVLLVISVVLRFNFEAEQLCVYGILVLVVYTFVSILFQFSITEIIIHKIFDEKGGYRD